MAVGEVLEQYDTGPGIGQRFAPRVTTSDTDPGAIGAGNIWLRAYDDTAVTGDILYQANIRNAADDGWLRPQLLQIVGGVLRSRVTLDGPATGGDIEVRDASGNQILLFAWDAEGEIDIQNNAADFSWVNKLQMQAGFMFVERTDAGGQHQLYMDASEVTLTRVSGTEVISLNAAGVAVTTAGAFTVNGLVVATVP